MGLIADIGHWLDRKFPDKVVVTKDAYLTLLARTEAAEKELASQDIRIKNLCKEVVTIANAAETMNTDLNKLKISAGFRGPGVNFPGITAPATMPPVAAQR